jgi:NAD(P)H-flavin reductase
VAQELAKRGYVVFNCEYRRGRILDNRTSPNGLVFRTVQQQRAAWVACQDGRGALRSIIKRAGEGFHNNLYRIDVNNIFIGGFSAGAVMVMSMAWFSNAMMDQAFPAAGTYTFAQALGGMDVDFYYGEPTIDYKSSIRGVACMWGGIGIPTAYNLNESAFFGQTTIKPVIAFHGFNDNVFPYSDDNLPNSKQNVYFSPSPDHPTDPSLNTTNFCTLQTLQLDNDIDGSNVDVITGSADNMHKIADSLGVPNEEYVDCQMHHGLDDDCNCPNDSQKKIKSGVCISCSFQSNFGTTATDRSGVELYIAQRIATFFQAVLGGIAGNLGRRVFIECKNTRVGCTQNVNGICAPSCNP